MKSTQNEVGVSKKELILRFAQDQDDTERSEVSRLLTP